MEQCKRCLLREAGEQVTYETLQSYLQTLPADALTDEEMYQKRITNCINCDSLLAGTCRECGCYVEVRARLKTAACPAVHKRW